MNCFDNVRRKLRSPSLDKDLALRESRNKPTSCSAISAQSFITALIISLDIGVWRDDRIEVI